MHGRSQRLTRSRQRSFVVGRLRKQPRSFGNNLIAGCQKSGIMKKLLYKLQWKVRRILLPIWGQECEQSDDLKGVLSPTVFYSYGKEYHRLYFLGRIK